MQLFIWVSRGRGRPCRPRGPLYLQLPRQEAAGHRASPQEQTSAHATLPPPPSPHRWCLEVREGLPTAPKRDLLLSRDPATCPSLWLGLLPPPTSPLVLPPPGTFCNKEAPPPLPPPATQAAVLGLPHPTPPLPLERQLQLWDTGWGEGIEGLDSPRQQGAESLSCKMPIDPIIPRPA